MQKACRLCDFSSCGYKTGAIAVKNERIIAEGYNQTLLGEKYCQYGECYREKNHLSGGREIEKVCSIHAEQNLIASAASAGVSLMSSILFVTTFPCLVCTRSIVKAGFKKVVYMSSYASNEGKALLEANGIQVERVGEEEVWGKITN